MDLEWSTEALSAVKLRRLSEVVTVYLTALRDAAAHQGKVEIRHRVDRLMPRMEVIQAMIEIEEEE